ncbi:PREDICTED: uncharacterized protein LOC108746202 isoform X1 [Trachymyrmex septentrionalis]|uniref:uncharacterized protein LOC108746202 isoform X1 n=1 Tax=Trachymyrmex septentrionalis TaxID=34720 RepID=UPI00084F5E32|nr:PREDICTED: uncharacterized protein LOC108746202 isoform X1 [Trachymyrmex septentrionalis]
MVNVILEVNCKMEDHPYTTLNSFTYVDCVKSLSENVIEGKESDDFLIQLYKERRYLYDKSHKDFQNKQIKENAWFEISTIMQQKNLGKRYTPKYCQTRCTSLRDQYSREKRNIRNNSKSGSTCSKRRTFPFFTQLSFLDNFIKRRRTFFNVERNRNALQFIKDTEAVIHEDNNNESTSESEYEQQNTIKVPQKRIINMCQDTSRDMENLEQVYDRDSNRTKQISGLRFKRRKIEDSKSIDDTLTNISKTILNFLKSTKKNTTDSIKTIDQSFANYIRVHLENISEPEKTVRKKMIIDALTAPIPKK